MRNRATSHGGTVARTVLSRPRMSSYRLALVFAFVAVLAGVSCRSRTSVATADNELHTDYADLFGVLGPNDLERWVAVRTKLRAGLDRACAGSACGGYTDLSTVQITCSASLARHTMHECAWIVGGSIDAVDGSTGTPTGGPRAITCSVPTQLTTSAFLDTLTVAGDAALDTPLTGTGHSLHDALLGCLAAPDAGAAPSADPANDFVALEDLFPAGTKQGDAWRSIGRSLQTSFDDACGDTYCEGDYADIRALRLACAVDRRRSIVQTCTWSFAMVSIDVAANGAINAATATRACPVTVDAPVTALLAALAGSDPLHATLPGRGTALNDALIGCL